ncbi:MAG: DUF2087 domain-containing protein [Ilumatobacteraceae bacterium]
MHSAATDDQFDGFGDEDRRVLGRFVRDGRIVQIPAKLTVRRVVLEWLVREFEPDRAYTEPMVNLIIGRLHADTAALRRYLVDEGLMVRAGGSYRRVT